jgi:hypothetical protein
LKTTYQLKYALLHNLVEIKTDDFDGFIHYDDIDFEQKNNEAELKTMELIKDEFNYFPEINSVI